jgi:hypothetical protein
MRRDTHAIVHPALNILPPILPKNTGLETEYGAKIS